MTSGSNLIIAILILFGALSLFASQENQYSKDSKRNVYFSESFSSLKEQVCVIQSQYISITSRLSKLEYDIPEKFQSLSNLFQTSKSNFHVDNNACIYYDEYELSDFEKFFIYSESDRNPPPQYATLAQLTAVSNQVAALSGSFSALSSNLTFLSNTVSSITSSLSNSQGSLQNLTIAYNRLDEICDNLTSVIKVNSDGSVVIAKSSPIIGKIEPRGNGSLYTLAQNWDRCCSKFRVSRDTQLESVTLYCDDPSKMPAPGNVYVSTVISNKFTGNYSFESWHCVNVDTSNFPRCVWTFVNNRKIPVYNDRDYLLCISKSNGALYPYVTSPFRQGSFYKPFGATEELPPDPPPNSPDPELPRSSPSAQDWFNYFFLYDWEESIFYPKELWSILKFTDDESFTFSENGLALESGNITVAGSEVVTSSSLGDMFVSMLAEYPNVLNSEITWNMFCDDLKDMLITTAGGTVTGLLTVSNLKLNGSGDWTVGSTNNPSDIVIVNPSGKISAPNGDLNLLATENGNIQAQSFLQLQNTTQCGIVEIPINLSASSQVTCSGLTSNGIILLTPRQETATPYWVEINVTNSSFRVNRPSEGDNSDSLSFNYLIIRK